MCVRNWKFKEHAVSQMRVNSSNVKKLGALFHAFVLLQLLWAEFETTASTETCKEVWRPCKRRRNLLVGLGGGVQMYVSFAISVCLSVRVSTFENSKTFKRVFIKADVGNGLTFVCTCYMKFYVYKRDWVRNPHRSWLSLSGESQKVAQPVRGSTTKMPSQSWTDTTPTQRSLNPKHLWRHCHYFQGPNLS